MNTGIFIPILIIAAPLLLLFFRAQHLSEHVYACPECFHRFKSKFSYFMLHPKGLINPGGISTALLKCPECKKTSPCRPSYDQSWPEHEPQSDTAPEPPPILRAERLLGVVSLLLGTVSLVKSMRYQTGYKPAGQ